VTSVKTDLLKATIRHRRDMGTAMIFDPTGASGEKAVKATPLFGCSSGVRGASSDRYYCC
jgi:hypothetical protein